MKQGRRKGTVCWRDQARCRQFQDIQEPEKGPEQVHLVCHWRWVYEKGCKAVSKIKRVSGISLSIYRAQTYQGQEETKGHLWCLWTSPWTRLGSSTKAKRIYQHREDCTGTSISGHPRVWQLYWRKVYSIRPVPKNRSQRISFQIFEADVQTVSMLGPL